MTAWMPLPMTGESLSVEPPAPRHGKAVRARVRSLLNASPEATAQRFRADWGEAALLHLPATERVERALLRLGHAATRAASAGAAANQALLMLRAFRDMEVDFIARREGPGVIGRAPDAQVRVNDESVSKRHAILSWSSRGVLLSDLGSLNGTKLNGAQLTGSVQLEDGDLISLGDANLVFVTSHLLFLQLESVRHSEHGAH